MPIAPLGETALWRKRDLDIGDCLEEAGRQVAGLAGPLQQRLGRGGALGRLGGGAHGVIAFTPSAVMTVGPVIVETPAGPISST